MIANCTMKKLAQLPHFLLIAAFVSFLTSCASFNPGWNEKVFANNSADITTLMLTAERTENTANNSEKVELLIKTYMEIERANPNNYDALWKIGNYHILMGAAYAEKHKDKKYHYREAIKYCEKAMAVNPDFYEAVTSGHDITESLDKLTFHEIDAMGYWYTARFYYFIEVLKPLSRVINTKIVIQNNEMIERIDELDPNWAGGGNYFSRGLYYIAIPERFGGSKERAEQEFAEAVSVGPNYLVNRWGRAKYFYQLVGEDVKMKEDLQWVVDQDPHEADNTYPWNVYFQKDAKKLLADK